MTRKQKPEHVQYRCIFFLNNSFNLQLFESMDTEPLTRRPTVETFFHFSVEYNPTLLLFFLMEEVGRVVKAHRKH